MRSKKYKSQESKSSKIFFNFFMEKSFGVFWLTKKESRILFVLIFVDFLETIIKLLINYIKTIFLFHSNFTLKLHVFYFYLIF